MSSFESFDDFDASESVSQSVDIKPFAFRDEKSSKEKTHEWLKDNFDMKVSKSVSRLNTYRKYNNFYKGIQWRDSALRDSRRDVDSTDRRPKQVMNFFFDKIEDRVSQMSRISTGFTLLPANHSDQDDINNAKSCKTLLTSRAESMGLEDIHDKAEKSKFLFGHVFQFVDWDKCAGPLDPKYKEYKDKGKKIPVLDKKGKPIKGKYITEDIHIGDVVVRNKKAYEVFTELNKTEWEKVNELDEVEWVNIEELKAMYPNKKELIQKEEKLYFEIDINDEFTNNDSMILVRTFWHKKTKFLPQGAKIVWCDSCILSMEDYPYEEDTLPCVPDTDIDIDGEFWGRPFLTNIEQLQKNYNNTESSQARDFGVGSAPKWMFPKGSVEVSSLNNQFTLVEYRGAIKPELVTPRATNPQSFDYQDRTEAKITKLSRTNDIMKGEIPQGITAASAIRLLDEKFSMQVLPLEKKRKKRVLSVYKMMLVRMGQFYSDKDGRMARMLGPNNEYLVKSFKKADFGKIADVKFEKVSILSDSKAGKISDIIDLNISTQTDPIFRREQVVQMLDLGLDEAFIDGATAAVTAARTVVEELLDGNEVPEPQAWDNFLVFYNVFDVTMQSFSFRTKVSKKIRERFAAYMTVLEGMMYERAIKNSKFAAELMALNNYPMFFSVPEPLTVVMQRHQQAMMAPQQTPSGGMDVSNLKEKSAKQAQTKEE